MDLSQGPFTLWEHDPLARTNTRRTEPPRARPYSHSHTDVYTAVPLTRVISTASMWVELGETAQRGRGRCACAAPTRSPHPHAASPPPRPRAQSMHSRQNIAARRRRHRSRRGRSSRPAGSAACAASRSANAGPPASRRRGRRPK